MPNIYIPRFIDHLMEIGINVGIKGAYRAEVCRDGHVIRQPHGPKMQPNVILNQALDKLFTGGTFNQMMVGAQAGTGTATPLVTDTALTTPVKTTNTWFNTAGFTTTNDTVNGAATHTVTWDFSSETSTITYNECGCGFSGPNLLATKALFPSGVSLNPGDNLRLTYALTFSVPATVTPVTVSLSPVGGFNASGQLKVCGQWGAEGVFGSAPNGFPSACDSNLYMNGSPSGAGQLCSGPTTFPTVNTQFTPTNIGSGSSPSLGTYTNGSFTRNQTFIWTPSQPTSTVSNVNGIGLCQDLPFCSVYLILTTAQTKANDHTLTMVYSATAAQV
jgi:hypothetical protein